MGDWNKAIEFVLSQEGGYQNHHDDPGNWTSGIPDIGENKGTNFGISAASYPGMDIRNITVEQAKNIYWHDYYVASGANRFDAPFDLLIFDTAVLHGVGTVQKWLEEVGPNPNRFAARRMRTYTSSKNFKTFGAGWINRMAALMEKMG